MRELSPGARVGPWRIVAVAGRGGMGIVYQAIDERSGAAAAIKVLPRDLAHDPELVERFRREARLAALVRHPRVVAFDGLHQEGDVLFTVSEWIPGGTLAAFLRDGGPLEWRRAVAIAAEIARGLAAIHAAGLVHRDLKPANVLLDASGAPRIADFGLAKRVVASPASVELTRTGEVVGTIAWMSPEQAIGLPVDARSDLHALGAILWWLLTGRAPFTGEGVAVAAKIANDPAPSARSIVPGVPVEVDALVRRLLSKKPEERGKSAAGVAEELDALGRERAPARRLGAALALALGLAAGVTWLAWPREERAPPLPPPTAPALVVSAATPAAPAVAADAVATEASRAAWIDLGKTRARSVTLQGEPRFRHSLPIKAIAFSPAGDRILAAGEEWYGRVWTRHGDALGILAIPGGASAVAFSPEGHTMALGGGRGEVALHSTPARRAKLAKAPRSVAPPSGKAESGGVLALGFRQDGKVGFAAYRDGTVLTFSTTAEGGPLVVQRSPTARLEVASFSPDARRLAVIDIAAFPRLLRPVGFGDWEDIELGAKEPIRAASCAIAADGRAAWGAREPGEDRSAPAARAWVFDENRGWTALRVPGGGVTRSLAWAGRELILGGEGIVAWDPVGGAVRSFPQVGDGPVVALAVSPDQKTLASAGSDRTVRLWSLETLKPLGSTSSPGALLQLDAVAGASVLAGATATGSVRLLDARTGRDVETFGPDRLEGARARAAKVIKGDRIFVACSDAVLRVLDRAGSMTGRFLGDAAPHAFDVTPDGARVVSVDRQAPFLRVGDLRRLGSAKVITLGALASHVRYADEHGDRAIVDGEDGSVSLWNARDGTQIASVQVHPRGWARVHPIGDMGVLTWDADGRLVLSDFLARRTGQIASLERTAARASALRSDGVAAVAGHDHRILLFDTGAWKELGTILLADEADYAEALAFAPDGALLSATGRGLTLRIELK